MLISEYQNEEAIDLLVDILEPTANILGDKDMAKAIQRNCSKMEAIKIALKNHESDVVQILARLDNIPIQEYKCNIFTITMKLLEILNDKELTDFFTSQAQMVAETSSIKPTENTKVKEI